MKRLFGGLLLAGGILVMTCSGLCSLVVIIGGADEVPRDPTILFVPLLVGGIPFAGGLGLFYAGRIMLRQERRASARTREDVREPFE